MHGKLNKGVDNLRSNPKKQSRFLCLKCGSMDGCIEGIQRNGHEREKYHIKDLWCCNCKETTHCLEIRHNDYFPDMRGKAEQLHRKFYGED